MAMVSSSTGPINSVLDKLPAGPDFSSLREALLGMKKQMLAYCVRGVVMSALARQWLLQLREIAYDVEEWLDERLIRSGGRFQLQPWSSDDLAQIQYFEVQIADAHDRGKMFGVHLETSMVTVDPESEKPPKLQLKDGFSALSCRQAPPPLVGLSGTEDQIVQDLMDDDHKLKVITVLGPGGIGKTTLAREVFNKQQSKFDCAAFVYVGWNPSRDAVLTDIACQVMPRTLLLPHDDKIVFRLFEFLDTKRYLIVIDDVWGVMDWTAITCALPGNNLGSRIITTTEMKNVANSCCIKPTDSLLFLNPLDNTDSRNLMLSRISCLEEDYVPGSKILHSSMLKMCGGNPLALGVAAGLLAVNSTLLSEFEIPENGMPMMKRILDLGYADLPLSMKSCFLYLGVFPKNNIIMKDRLIHRWIAEGFLHISEEESLTEIGERYFSELARRGLIQLVFEEYDDCPIGFTVHGAIHEFILSLSGEENFITMGEELCSGSYPCEKIRRFAHDCSRQIESSILASSAMHLAGVRSLTVSGDTKGQLHLSGFKLIRVLDLEDARGLRCNQLRSIGHMVFLRYLGLKGSDVTTLPEEVQALEHLTTIDVRKTSVQYLLKLRSTKLVSVLADRVLISREMEDMHELEELGTIIVNEQYPLDSVTKLVNSLKLLRMLSVELKHHDRKGLLHFLAVVKKSNLQTLFVNECSYPLLDILGGRPLQQLQKFILRIHRRFWKIPRGVSYLKDVTHLHINVFEINSVGLSILAGLPNLVVLCLGSHHIREGCMLINQELKDCFPCLRKFDFKCLYGVGLKFGPGVMPHLRRLCLEFGIMANEATETISGFGDFEFVIQHLTSLVQVDIGIKCDGPLSSSDVEDTRRIIRDQVSLLPNHPLLKLEISRHKE